MSLPAGPPPPTEDGFCRLQPSSPPSFQHSALGDPLLVWSVIRSFPMQERRADRRTEERKDALPNLSQRSPISFSDREKQDTTATTKSAPLGAIFIAGFCCQIGVVVSDNYTHASGSEISSYSICKSPFGFHFHDVLPVAR